MAGAYRCRWYIHEQRGVGMLMKDLDSCTWWLLCQKMKWHLKIDHWKNEVSFRKSFQGWCGQRGFLEDFHADRVLGFSTKTPICLKAKFILNRSADQSASILKARDLRWKSLNPLSWIIKIWPNILDISLAGADFIWFWWEITVFVYRSPNGNAEIYQNRNPFRIRSFSIFTGNGF